MIIEVPRHVDLGGISQVVPGSSWAEPGLYADPPANSRTREPGQVAPFDPTPQEVVDRMLALAGVQKSDVVYDLGAGDGRVVIAAAKNTARRQSVSRSIRDSSSSPAKMSGNSAWEN